MEEYKLNTGNLGTDGASDQPVQKKSKMLWLVILTTIILVSGMTFTGLTTIPLIMQKTGVNVVEWLVQLIVMFPISWMIAVPCAIFGLIEAIAITKRLTKGLVIYTWIFYGLFFVFEAVILMMVILG